MSSKTNKIGDRTRLQRLGGWLQNKLPVYVGEFVMVAAVIAVGFYALEHYTPVNERAQGVIVTLFVLGLVWITKRTPKKK